jgi:hypothetical protein
MSCRNPNSKISAKISETLETLGPKFQNAQNFIWRVSGGMRGEGHTLLSKRMPQHSSFNGLKHPKEEGRRKFLETLGGSCTELQKKGEDS